MGCTVYLNWNNSITFNNIAESGLYCVNLYRQSKLVETAVMELVDLLKSPLTEKERENMMPQENAQEQDAYTVLLNNFTTKNTEALVRCKSQ